MSFDVIGGDFPKGGGYFGSTNITLPAGQWGKKQEVPTYLLQSVELVSQETTHHKAHRIGKGLAGAALFGPLGLAFGALAEGKTTNKVSFVVQLTDGRSFLATADNRTFLKIKAASVGSAQPRNAAAMALPLKSVSHPQGLNYTDYLADAPTTGRSNTNQFGRDITENLISLLRENGWQVQQQAKRPGQRYAVILAQQGIFALAIACTTETLSDYLFGNMVDALEPYTNLQRFVLGNSISPSLARTASSIGITVGELHQAMQLIPA